MPPHGYIHCMPYGKVLFEPMPSPCASATVPFEFRLSPRHPGYVMTVWVETRVKRMERHVVVARNKRCEESIVEMEEEVER